MPNDASQRFAEPDLQVDYPEPLPIRNEPSFEARALKVIDMGLKATAPEMKAISALSLTFVLTILTVLKPEKGLVKLIASTIFAVAAGCICEITKRK